LLNPPQRKNWWVYPRIPAETDQALSAFPDILRQLLFNRGYLTEAAAVEYLNASQPLGNPLLLLDMEKAVKRLLHAIDHGETIVVYGDYDVDGVSATALMVQVLKTLGARGQPLHPPTGSMKATASIVKQSLCWRIRELKSF